MDLTTRLKHPGYTAYTGGLVLAHDDARRDMREAADEIGRYAAQVSDMDAEMDRYATENRQLREALGDIVELLSDEDMDDMGRNRNARLRANLALGDEQYARPKEG